MNMYLLVARVNDYYTSLTPLGIFSSYAKAEDVLFLKFDDVQFSPRPYESWLFDSILCDRSIVPTKQFKGTCKDDDTMYQVDIAILEMELDNDNLCSNTKQTQVR